MGGLSFLKHQMSPKLSQGSVSQIIFNRAAVGVRGGSYSAFGLLFIFLVLSVTISKPPLMMSSSANRPRSIYQYSNMAPRLSGQTSIFGVVFFVFESLLGTERQKKL